MTDFDAICDICRDGDYVRDLEHQLAEAEAELSALTDALDDSNELMASLGSFGRLLRDHRHQVDPLAGFSVRWDAAERRWVVGAA